MPVRVDSEEIHEAAWQKGYMSFWECIPFSKNPYYVFSPTYLLWSKGWAAGFLECTKKPGKENDERA